MVRTLAALLAALMLVVTGCGGGGEPADSSDTGQSAGDAAFGKTTPGTSDFDEQTWQLQDGDTETPDATTSPATPSGDNHSPQISSIALEPTGTTVAKGGTVRLTVNATDVDGDTLTCDWGATGGTFDSKDGLRAVWRTPDMTGTFVVTVTVSDGRGGSATAQQSLTVAANNSPAISSMTLSATAVGPGGSVVASGTAADPDGDAVSYKWTADGGTVTGTGQNITWVAPQVTPGEQSQYHIQLTVEDGKGGSDVRIATVEIVFGYVTEVFTPVPVSTGTVVRNGGADTSRVRTGDDAANENFRAFWTFDLGKLRSTDVQQATLSFTHKQTVGDPFSLDNLALGLGGIRVWIVRYDATNLPRYGVVTIKEVQELFAPDQNGEPLRESPSDYDITGYVERIGDNMATDDYVQLMVAFQKVTNNDDVEDSMEWSAATITVTYAPA